MTDDHVEDLDVNAQDSDEIKGGAFDAFRQAQKVTPVDQLTKKINAGGVGTPDTNYLKL